MNQPPITDQSCMKCCWSLYISVEGNENHEYLRNRVSANKYTGNVNTPYIHKEAHQESHVNKTLH